MLLLNDRKSIIKTVKSLELMRLTSFLSLRLVLQRRRWKDWGPDQVNIGVMTVTESVTICHSLGGGLHCELWEGSRIRLMGGFRQFELGPTIGMAEQNLLNVLPRSLRATIAKPRVFWFLEYEHVSQEPCQRVLLLLTSQ